MINKPDGAQSRASSSEKGGEHTPSRAGSRWTKRKFSSRFTISAWMALVGGESSSKRLSEKAEASTTLAAAACRSFAFNQVRLPDCDRVSGA